MMCFFVFLMLILEIDEPKVYSKLYLSRKLKDSETKSSLNILTTIEIDNIIKPVIHQNYRKLKKTIKIPLYAPIDYVLRKL